LDRRVCEFEDRLFNNRVTGEKKCMQTAYRICETPSKWEKIELQQFVKDKRKTKG
jgi:hypothetical protein